MLIMSQDGKKLVNLSQTVSVAISHYYNSPIDKKWTVEAESAGDGACITLGTYSNETRAEHAMEFIFYFYSTEKKAYKMPADIQSLESVSDE